MTCPADADGLPGSIASLLRPSAYPHPVDRVELVQTHISYVLLAGDYAYKVKKPVDFGFVDYTTLEQRRHFCEEEIRLNRRLCRGIYLGVVPIARNDDGELQIGTTGVPIEYAVQMRRVARERVLPSLIDRGVTDEPLMRRVARRIEVFHRAAATGKEISRYGSIDALRFNWHDNLTQLAPHEGVTVDAGTLDDLRAYGERFFHTRRAILDRRAHGGSIRECHGDLRADAIVVDEDGEICVMDCIEFNDRLRYGDVAGDVGFLMMDLESRGRRDLADAFCTAYLGFLPDETLPVVLPYYQCYRACVRGKVESMRSAETEIPPALRAEARERARAYLSLALCHAAADESDEARLVMMVGLSGSGKSHLAGVLAARSGAALISSDATRKRLLGVPLDSPRAAQFGAGIYEEEERRRVYAAMLDAAEAYVRDGVSVVLDATFGERAHRDAVRSLAERYRIPGLAVVVATGEAAVRRHFELRAQEQGGASDADFAIYEAQRARFEALGDDEPGPRVAVDGAAAVSDNADVVIGMLQRVAR
jgi:hypothetical protein